ncbi:4Fe-4S dicluster domain-containing protein [Anaerobacillus alkaliphilus]|uniref:4Fe-4S dicluster domain-containing protein n=1 Tax=Anaerobacillus alkaliphilus TaxID=1548597 RepID=A0A4V1LGJ4_9BACI|nr:4Fe-4S dicluster domain-containing protein [Anaerobacillus alkaliphilus]RXJ01898.1 4Fe-4S dicluster domain-containing protein [Anaerobacillus alkaliphilus]
MSQFESQKGMFIDTTLCHGCKACEVACKQWNEIPANPAPSLTGNSYDNTGGLDGQNWRHVKFIEDISDDRSDSRWLFLSDSCKHCTLAGCMSVCPTNAIIRTEFDTVYIDHDTCIGCKYCITGCPFGVIGIGDLSGTAEKCSLCYDRLQVGQEPACAQSCPTDSIEFGDVEDLMVMARKREEYLQSTGNFKAKVYGDSDILGGLNVFYLLQDTPEKYGLPSNPQMPQKTMLGGYWSSVFSLFAVGLVSLLSFRSYRERKLLEEKTTTSA